MNKESHLPIGVFDSGIGGLTVFREIAKQHPEEDLIYFGDTAHVPYGSKSPEAVTRFSLAVGKFLESRGIKALVVACNTASALALPELKRSLKVPVFGMIGAGARAAAAATRGGGIGIIGTLATVNSGAYVKELRRILPKAKTSSIPCPLFVPLVEEGWSDHPSTTVVVGEYLAPFKRKGIDTLIMGCTHYPFLVKSIKRVMGPKIHLINPAEEVARETEDHLAKAGLRRRGREGTRTFYSSDAPEHFQKVARRLGIKVDSVELHPFDVGSKN